MDRPPVPVSDAPWPRRANKACCNCRRDKIKCDGERPCAACLRRGLPDDKCIDGCPPCRRSRARCDGGDPCSRCMELAIACTDEPASPNTSVDEHSQRSFPGGSIRSVPTAGRAKLACQACRRDNKKCDDNRPCMRCISRMEECIHVDRTPKVVKHRCVNCRKDNKKCEDNRPCRHCVEMNIDCTDAPRKGSGGTRVKMACVSCRRNKVQCDPERPCRVCVRRGLQCTLPSCTCAGTGSEPGHCSFCRSQRVRKSSQTPVGSVMDYEERLSDISGTPSPITSSLSGFAERTSFQVPLDEPNRSYGRHVTLQDNSLHIDNLASADPRPPYTANYYSAQQQLASHQQIGHGINSRQDMSVNFLQQTQPDFTQGGQVWRDFDFQGSAVGSGAGLDKYFARGLDMGPPAHSSCSSGQAGLLLHYNQESSFLHLGNNADGRVNFDNGVGVGIGSSEADSLANIGDMSHSYGPGPMAMPVSMTIPVPHSDHSHMNIGVRNAGQMDMHPQLRRSAYYLTSDSRTAQHGGGS